MKSTKITLFSFFLLSAFISHLPSTTLADVVLDSAGDPLQNGGLYYMVSVLRPRGGVAFAATGNETCPLTVVQLVISNGLPIRIQSPKYIGVVTESLPLKLSFPVVAPCAPRPSWWTIVDGLPEGPAVKLTGYENTVNGWFFIRKSFSRDYKLIFCATASGHLCSDIGLYFDGSGSPRLVLADNGGETVSFRKVGSSSA